MFSDILEPQYGEDKSPPDPTKITQIILYFDKPDSLELKRLAKIAMKDFWPGTYIEEGNISDLYLLLLKKHYANTEVKATDDRPASGVAVEGQVAG